MDWASLATAILSVLVAGGSVLVAIAAKRDASRAADAAEKAAQESKRANDLMVVYKDPYWVLTSETEPQNSYAGGPVTELRLTNRGDSPGRNVTIEFDFDPTHLHILPQSWPFIDRGEYVTFGTLFELQPGAMSGGSRWNIDVATNPDRNMATITWDSPAGERKPQRVQLPQCHRSLHTTDTQA